MFSRTFIVRFLIVCFIAFVGHYLFVKTWVPTASVRSSPAPALTRSPGPLIPASALNTALDFETTTDGPFQYNHTSWTPEYAPVHLRFPPNPLKGVVLLFHGCNHDGQDFFRILEERAIVAGLMQRDFAAVAFTSKNRASRCWSSADIPLVKSSFERLGFDPRLPVFAFGASSGGGFVTMLPPTIPVDGVIPEIAPGSRDAGDRLSVPAVFIYMSGDHHFASKEAITATREKLKARNIPNEAFEVRPFKLPPFIFREKLPEWFDDKQSQKLFDFLLKGKFVDESGQLQRDPRRTQIVDDSMKLLLEEGIVKETDKTLVKDNLVELFNAAWAVHELTRENVKEAIDFLMLHTKKGV
jgi:hypothetical protein